MISWPVASSSVRVVRPGQPYAIDVANREISLPADFTDYNFHTAHSKWQKLERVFNMNRAIWYVWFAIGMLIVGDAEFL